MRLRHHIYCLFIVSLLLVSCKTTKDVHHVNPDLLAAFTFNSQIWGDIYWIYKDSATGQSDTFFYTGGYGSPINKDKYTQEVGQRIYTKAGGQINIHGFDFDLIENYCNFNISGNDIASSPKASYSFDYFPLFTFPFKEGVLPANDNGFGLGTKTGTVTAINTTITPGLHTFDKVAIIHYVNTPGNPFFDDWYYIREHIGIVKMKLYHPDDSIDMTMNLHDYYLP